MIPIIECLRCSIPLTMAEFRQQQGHCDRCQKVIADHVKWQKTLDEANKLALKCQE